MEAYTSFAAVYDTFMDNVPYDRWASGIDSLLKKYLPSSADRPMVLDLGCGTGQITRRLRDLGYDMTGVDSSDEMLEIARARENDDSIPTANIQNTMILTGPSATIYNRGMGKLKKKLKEQESESKLMGNRANVLKDQHLKTEE